MLKYHTTVLFQQFTKTLDQFSYYLRQTKICKFACLFDLSELKDSQQFCGTFTGQYFNKCLVKTTHCSLTIFTSLSSAIKQLLEKFHFELLHAFNFFCT